MTSQKNVVIVVLLSVSIPSRGFWFFEGARPVGRAYTWYDEVSIPSRGFWFFEVSLSQRYTDQDIIDPVSIPSRGFWFFEGNQ